MTTRLPDATRSLEEAARVYNTDLPELTASELTSEIYRAARIAARDPQAFVWRGRDPITAREWADERIEACLARLAVPAPSRPKGKVTAWVR